MVVSVTSLAGLGGLAAIVDVFDISKTTKLFDHEKSSSVLQVTVKQR